MTNTTKLHSLPLQQTKSASCTVTPGYNDISLCNTLPVTSGILWYHLIPHF
jgi:hypothetical protein